jgi:hypothetical protein
VEEPLSITLTRDNEGLHFDVTVDVGEFLPSRYLSLSGTISPKLPQGYHWTVYGIFRDLKEHALAE